MYYEAKNVKHIKNYLLEIVFADNSKGTIDLSEYTKRGGVFEKFKDLEFFKKVFVNKELGVLTWPGGIDIALETIYAKTTGRSLQKAV